LLLAPLDRDVTKEQLYRQAKRLGIEGRSKMTKSQLKMAVGRHHR
jgi:Rho termination factor, N-terminal domain